MLLPRQYAGAFSASHPWQCRSSNTMHSASSMSLWGSGQEAGRLSPPSICTRSTCPACSASCHGANVRSCSCHSSHRLSSSESGCVLLVSTAADVCAAGGGAGHTGANSYSCARPAQHPGCRLCVLLAFENSCERDNSSAQVMLLTVMHSSQAGRHVEHGDKAIASSAPWRCTKVSSGKLSWRGGPSLSLCCF